MDAAGEKHTNGRQPATADIQLSSKDWRLFGQWTWSFWRKSDCSVPASSLSSSDSGCFFPIQTTDELSLILDLCQASLPPTVKNVSSNSPIRLFYR